MGIGEKTHKFHRDQTNDGNRFKIGGINDWRRRKRRTGTQSFSNFPASSRSRNFISKRNLDIVHWLSTFDNLLSHNIATKNVGDHCCGRWILLSLSDIIMCKHNLCIVYKWKFIDRLLTCWYNMKSKKSPFEYPFHDRNNHFLSRFQNTLPF